MLAGIALADYKEDVGYTRLEDELEAGIPDGSNVIVTQTEAGDDWKPDDTTSEFSGKTFTFAQRPGGISGHANGVGLRFYGNVTSMTPGISSIFSYSASYWLVQQEGSQFVSDYLRVGFPWQPAVSSSRVANHSWIGDLGTLNTDALKRLDWVIDTDEYIHCASVCLSGQPLLGSAFNAISVGRTSGESGSGTVGADAPYTAGRNSPLLVAPMPNPSTAIPVVASAASLLIDVGHNNPGLSTDPESQYTINRSNLTIYNAERSEVIKAALMAGADRETSNSSIDDDIIDYQDDTGNGLDSEYGAGQVNIYYSYHIIAAGEQNGAVEPDVGGEIAFRGFDYDPAFGGASGSNDTAYYYFTVASGNFTIWASLVWNIYIDGSDFSSSGNWQLFDLDLYLYDITNPAEPVLKASSESSDENTENIWMQVSGGKDYMLQVIPKAGQGSFLWDYALAWRIEPVAATVPGPTMSLIPAAGLLLLIGFAHLKQRGHRVHRERMVQLVQNDPNDFNVLNHLNDPNDPNVHNQSNESNQ